MEKEIHIHELYERLGLSPKSRARWIRRINTKLPFQNLDYNPMVYKETWNAFIAPHTIGDFEAVEAFWLDGQRYPQTIEEHSNTNVINPFQENMMRILEQLSVSVINNSNETMIISKQLFELRNAIEVQSRALLDIRVIIANKKIGPNESIRDQITGQINYLWGRSQGRFSQKELYDSMYSQYCEQYDPSFLEKFHKYIKEHPSPKISKIEFAERLGQHVMLRLFKIAKTLTVY